MDCGCRRLASWQSQRGVMTVHNNAGVLCLFLLVDLAKFEEESWVDAFLDSRVGATNGFVVELDDMMVPERSFQVCNWLYFADCVNGTKSVKLSWLMRQNQGLLLEVVMKSKFEKVKRKRNQDNYVFVRST
eukprot:3620168-Ditylum_brightwellii.AAC.1